MNLVQSQTLDHKKSEVLFRKKLVRQHLGEKSFFPGQPDTNLILKEFKKRLKVTKEDFQDLLAKKVQISPYLEIGAEKCQRAMYLSSTLDAKGFAGDISAESLASADRFIKILGFGSMPIRVCLDAYNLPFRSNSMPLVFFYETLHHFPHPKPVLEEAYRVLKPGGHIFFNEEPVKQLLNLRLFRRDLRLNVLEKILKYTLILPFISTIGKSEVEHGILEEAFTLKVWRESLRFPEVRATIKPYPIGWEQHLSNLDLLSKLLIIVQGGSIKALIAAKKDPNQIFLPRNILEVLRCPDCKIDKSLRILSNKKLKLSCASCKRVFKESFGVLNLLPKSLNLSLYNLPAGRQVLKYPKVSIIFPNYNGGNEPLDCLSSIQKLNYPKDRLEAIVVDNGSTDGSDLQIRKRFPKVILLKNKYNLGFAKAINQGAEKSKGEYLFITNDDIVFDKNSLRFMVNYAMQNPNVGLLGGKIFLKEAPQKICSSGYMMNLWTGHIYISPYAHKNHEPDWVQGCAMLISKPIFKILGGLDEAFTHYFEDQDLALRIRRLGFKVVYLPKALFWHGEGTTANKNIDKKTFEWYKNKFRFILKNLPVLNILSIFFVQFFLILPYRILCFDKRSICMIHGLLWNLKRL